MVVIRLMVLALLFIGLSGCCLKSITLKPQMDAISLKAASVGSFSGEINMEFKDCCPTPKQKQIALSIQSKVEELYAKLLKDEISLEEYNKKLQAASDAINNVVLICSSINQNKSFPTLGPAFSFDSLDAAWEKLGQVEKNL